MARTSKKNAKRLETYQHEIELSSAWRKQEGFDDLWIRLRELYEGKHFTDLKPEDQIAVNIAFATINVIYPAVSVAQPRIGVMANAQDNEDRALFAEAILNFQWKHHGVHQPTRRAVKDFLIFGHGWVKIGWVNLEDEVELSDNEYRDELYARMDELSTAGSMGGLPTPEEIEQLVPHTKMVTLEDRPFVERISPHDILVDMDATCEQDMRWISQRIIRPLNEAREDMRYKQSARLNLRGTSTVNLTLDKRDQKRYGNEIQRVTIWEHYDLVNGTMCVFADGADEFLVDPVRMPYHFGQPFRMVRNYDVPGQFYPIGDLEMIEPLQQELNKTRSALMNARKAFGRKYLVREAALSQKAQRALSSDEDNVAVPIEDDRPFDEIIKAMPHAAINPELYAWNDTIEGDIQNVSGVTEYQRGTSPNVRRTATEASMIQDATNARSADKLTTIETFISDIARAILQVNQQYLTGDKVARVVGRNGQQMWLPYTRDDIIGEYDFNVEAGSTAPSNDQSRRQEALVLAQTMAPFIEMGIIDPVAMAKHLLQEGFRIRGVEKFISPDAMQMLEMKKAQMAQELAMGQQRVEQNEAMAMGGPPEAQGPQGVGAPNMDPMSLVAAQQAA